MKWAFFCLLFVNAIYAMWYQYRAPHALSIPERETRPIVSEVASAAGGVATLKLLSELQGNDLSRLSSGPDSSVGDSEPTPKVGGLCSSFGPVNSIKEGEMIAARLDSFGVQAKTVEVSVKDKPIYWVYIPPMSSRKAALRMLKELQAKNIDSYVITDGKLKDGVSLGLFANKASAYQLKEDMLQRSYEAALLEQDKYRKESWVLIDDSEIDMGWLDQTFWDGLVRDFPHLIKRKTLCNTLATNK